MRTLFLIVSVVYFAQGASEKGTPKEDLLKKQTHLRPSRRKIAEETSPEDYADTCASGQVAQYQRTSCDPESDALSPVVVASYSTADCSGEPLAFAADPLLAELASLDMCIPGTASMDGSMGVCEGDTLVDLFFNNSKCEGEPAYNVTKTQCELFCVEPSRGGGPGTCNMYDDTPIEGCVCDNTCSSCGYYEEAYDGIPPYEDCESCTFPDGPFDCTACRDGLVKTVLFADGMGICVPPATPQCFEAPGGDAISGCTCDVSCGSCGYNQWPANPDNCLTCRPGLTLVPRWTDGSGICNPPEMLVIVVAPEDSDSAQGYSIFAGMMGAQHTSKSGVTLQYIGALALVVCMAGVAVGGYMRKRAVDRNHNIPRETTPLVPAVEVNLSPSP